MWHLDADATPFVRDAAEESAAAPPRPIGSEVQSLWADEVEDEITSDLATMLCSPILASEQDVRRVRWADEESDLAPPQTASPPPADETVEQGVRRVRDRLSRNRREMRAANARIAVLESTGATKTVLIATLRATIDARDARIEALEKQATTFGAWFNGKEF